MKTDKDRLKLYVNTINDCAGHIKKIVDEINQKENLAFEDLEALDFLEFTGSVINDFINYVETIKLNMTE